MDRVNQILKIKRDFQNKLDRLAAKVKSRSNLRLYKLTFLILNAYSMRKIEDKRQAKMEIFAKLKLKEFKMRRIFNGIRQFVDWQHRWTATVQANFIKQRVKNTFRDLYLNTISNRLQKTAIARMKRNCLRAIKEEVRDMRNMHDIFVQRNNYKTKMKVLNGLHKYT